MQQVFQDLCRSKTLFANIAVLSLDNYKKCRHLFIQASQLCHLNYSTTKAILRDLMPYERKLIKRLVQLKKKHIGLGKYGNEVRCTYKQCEFLFQKTEKQLDVATCEVKAEDESFASKQTIEVITTIGYDFFIENLHDTASNENWTK